MVGERRIRVVKDLGPPCRVCLTKTCNTTPLKAQMDENNTSESILEVLERVTFTKVSIFLL